MQKRIKSAIPIYLMGIVFAACAIFFPMHTYLHLVIIIGVAGLSYFLFGAIFRGKLVEVPMEVSFERSGDSEADKALSQGSQYVKRLSELGLGAAARGDDKIRGQIAHLQKISIQIFDFIQKNPGHTRKINTFMDYYYPTALKFLESNEDISIKTTRGSNMTETLDKISESLFKIEEAFEHQLDSLYSDKVLDITTDIAVLEGIMSRGGM